MTTSTPKDADDVILLRDHTDQKNPEVFWVKRSTRLAFLGGYRAFPGGQRLSHARQSVWRWGKIHVVVGLACSTDLLTPKPHGNKLPPLYLSATALARLQSQTGKLLSY